MVVGSNPAVPTKLEISRDENDQSNLSDLPSLKKWPLLENFVILIQASENFRVLIFSTTSTLFCFLSA